MMPTVTAGGQYVCNRARPIAFPRPYATMAGPMWFPGRARQAMSPALANSTPVTSCSHCRVVTIRPYRFMRTPSGGCERGRRDGVLAIRVHREVLLEVGEL